MTFNDPNPEKFAEIINKAARYLCNKFEDGRWGPTKTTAMTIWALQESGVKKEKILFVEALRDLIENEGTFVHGKGLSFDEEIWETAVVLIALAKVDHDKEQKESEGVFKEQIESIKKWLLSQVSDGEKFANFNEEPWETMWVLTALYESNVVNNDDIQMFKRCIAWLLDIRNSEGILISLHNMGFLLAVLNYTIPFLDLENQGDIKIYQEYQEAIKCCEEFLKRQFDNNKKDNMLWSDEPWSIGHILHGIAGSPERIKKFFTNNEINGEIIEWCNNSWDSSSGFGSVKNTCDMLVGLTKYYCSMEAYLRNDDPAAKSQAIAKASNNIVLEDQDRRLKKTVVYPLWGKGKKLKLKENLVFLIMQFKRSWSKDLIKLVTEVFNEKDGSWIVRNALKFWDSENAIYKIWKLINTASIIIADIGKDQPSSNVMYEIGIAHTLGKRVIILTQNDPNDIPFDIRLSEVIPYNFNSRVERNNFQDRLDETLEQLFQRKQRLL